jgi:hypothetical protein
MRNTAVRPWDGGASAGAGYGHLTRSMGVVRAARPDVGLTISGATVAASREGSFCQGGGCSGTCGDGPASSAPLTLIHATTPIRLDFVADVEVNQIHGDIWQGETIAGRPIESFTLADGLRSYTTTALKPGAGTTSPFRSAGPGSSIAATALARSSSTSRRPSERCADREVTTFPERVSGIEPPLRRWERRLLPLQHTRNRARTILGGLANPFRPIELLRGPDAMAVRTTHIAFRDLGQESRPAAAADH